jgi:hypothetical protein
MTYKDKELYEKTNNLHIYLQNTLNKELITNYQHFTITQKYCVEEGYFVLIKNSDNNEKIIGIIPINSNSIYSINETFIIKDFTNIITHFIHKTLIISKKPIILCDKQGCILCLDKDNNISNFFYKKQNLNKLFILDNYDIDYESFYCVAKSCDVNNEYSKLTNKNKIIDFLINYNF